MDATEKDKAQPSTKHTIEVFISKTKLFGRAQAKGHKGNDKSNPRKLALKSLQKVLHKITDLYRISSI